MKQTSFASKTNVPALDRSVAIIDIVNNNPIPMNAAQIVRTLDIPRSSGHALLAALVEHGLLVKDTEQRYAVGSQIMRWTQGFLAQQNIIAAFQDEVSNTPQLATYSLTLTYREKRDVICMACHNGTARLGFTFDMGLRLPAGLSATGKAILSTLPVEDVHQLYDNHWHLPLTPHSITSVDLLLEELNIIRTRGYAIDDRQVRDGMYCIGVPVFNHDNQANNGIALSLQKAEATPDSVKILGDQLRKMADTLSYRLGATLNND